MARILVIDDDALVGKSLSRLFRDAGHDVVLANTLSLGISEAEKGVDVVYLDLDLPDGDGLAVIDELAAVESQPEVIVITGMGSGYAAQKTMESSAWDYISKPASPQVVLDSLGSALDYRKEAKQHQVSLCDFDDCGMVGESPAMLRTLIEIGRAAKSEASVLISGETGVGKELTARAVHKNSTRKNGPFVVVDCSNLTESLIESVLYGHVKGAFTGAHADRRGLVAEADGGTLFLDEIGELPLTLQKSFLRVLQERRYRPVGSGKELTSDFRLVAATNRNIMQMVKDNLFRSDLLYRVRTVEIVVPPLRERVSDIGSLVNHFMAQICDRYGLEDKSSSSELLRVAECYSWPGNIREMRNVIEAAVIHAGAAPIVYPKHLPSHVRLAFLKAKENEKERCLQNEVFEDVDKGASACETAEILSYAEYKIQRDRDYFSMLMEANNNNILHVSKISGLSVPSIYRHLIIAGLSTKRQKPS